MQTQLVRYEAARSALAEARRVDEVKDIRDKAEALRCYARLAQDRQLEIDAVEIRVRAERRVGEINNAARDAGFLAKHGGGRPKKGEISKTTLRKAGIDKKLSARASKLASVPSEKFEANLQGWRARALIRQAKITPTAVVAAAAPITQSREREVPYRLSYTDVRRLKVAELRRASAFFSALEKHCGGALGSEVVGDIISDTTIRQILRGSN